MAKCSSARGACYSQQTPSSTAGAEWRGSVSRMRATWAAVAGRVRHVPASLISFSRSLPLSTRAAAPGRAAISLSQHGSAGFDQYP